MPANSTFAIDRLIPDTLRLILGLIACSHRTSPGHRTSAGPRLVRDFWLKFIGVKEVYTVVVESTTWRGKDKGEESIARGQAEAKKLAANF
jgi:FMN-dependent NADH-azoreductase